MPTIYLQHPLNPDAENVEVEFEITSYGTSPSTFCLPEDSDPGEPPEFEVTAVREDAGEGDDILSRLDGIQLAKLDEQVAEHGDFSPPEPDWD